MVVWLVRNLKKGYFNTHKMERVGEGEGFGLKWGVGFTFPFD